MAVLKRQTDFSLLEPKSHCILKGLERQHRSLLNSFGLLEANPTLYALHVPGWDLGSLPECTLMADLQQASPAPNIGAFGNTALQRCHQGNAPAFRSHQPQTNSRRSLHRAEGDAGEVPLSAASPGSTQQRAWKTTCFN